MKNLIFKIKWTILFRIGKIVHKKENRTAIIVNTFEDDEIGKAALRIYNDYRQQKEEAIIMCAFNNAPMGKYLLDIRHIYIFNNSPEKLAEYCYKHNIYSFIYVEKEILVRAAKIFGIATSYYNVKNEAK